MLLSQIIPLLRNNDNGEKLTILHGFKVLFCGTLTEFEANPTINGTISSIGAQDYNKFIIHINPTKK